MPEMDMLQIRFGYGHGPHIALGTPGSLLESAHARRADHEYPILSYADAMALEFQRQAAFGAGQTGDDESSETAVTLRAQLRAAPAHALQAALARILDADAPFQERLTWFWADHFTVVGRNEAQSAGAPAFIDEAIRPHILGTFADMLKAVVRHPAMLVYLDQHVSFGPDSRVGIAQNRGLNENFARELLELHTLGVNSKYSQQDVRAAAELLTGLTLNDSRGFMFNHMMAQPGYETILNKPFGSPGAAQLDDIDAFLEELARHPDTIRHLCTKLVVHFVADIPPPPLIAELIAVWQDTDGDLAAISEALVTHPLAVLTPPQKAKQPMTFMASVLIALGLRGRDIAQMSVQDVIRIFVAPLRNMGQPFLSPSGPDGWPEESANWITPQGLATRINWASWMVRLWGQNIADPREFLNTTLRSQADDVLHFAVSAAETRTEALVLIFASPSFNRG